MAKFIVPPLVGLCGAEQSGKSTVAQRLKGRWGYSITPLAKPFKDMLSAMGIPYENLYGSKKGEPLDLLNGKSARHAMQTLGTEWRDTIHRDLWLNCWARVWKPRVGKGLCSLVVDDLRFEHEYKFFKPLGMKIITITRGNEPPPDPKAHASTLGWYNIPFDYVIENTGTREELWGKVDKIMGDCLEPAPPKDIFEELMG